MTPTVPSKQFVVLIVEDEIALAEMLKNQLMTLGVALIATAYNVWDARAFVERIHPNLILCDNRLPGGPGINFLEEVKASHPEMFRCLMSGDFRPTEQQADDHNFLAKPMGLTISSLTDIVSRAKAQAGIK